MKTNLYLIEIISSINEENLIKIIIKDRTHKAEVVFDSGLAKYIGLLCHNHDESNYLMYYGFFVAESYTLALRDAVNKYIEACDIHNIPDIEIDYQL